MQPTFATGAQVVVFDLETTGLPRTRGFNLWYPPENLDAYASSRMIELACVTLTKTDSGWTEGASHSFLFRPADTPDGPAFTIKNSQFHGITQDMALAEGVSLAAVADDIAALFAVDAWVAHNVHFDRNILLSEFVRLGRPLPSSIPFHCTMMIGWKHLVLRKYPTLIELVKALNVVSTLPRHRALPDALDCAHCFITLQAHK